MPIVVGIVVLVLLAALGLGIYLIVQNAGDNHPAATGDDDLRRTGAVDHGAVDARRPAPPDADPVDSTEPTDDAVAIPALRGLAAGGRARRR